MPGFTPPTMPQALSTNDRLFSRYSIDVGISVVKGGGVFRRTPFPALAEIADLEEGVEWFQGGRSYEVTEDVAADLERDGFSVILLGYGQGRYGYGAYGG